MLEELFDLVREHALVLVAAAGFLEVFRLLVLGVTVGVAFGFEWTPI